MTVDPIQADLNIRFTYRADRGESWRILRDTGQIWGDCEDYALTLIWLLEGQSTLRFWWALITFKYVLWQCHAPNGRGHIVLWRRGIGWTDNIQRRTVDRQYLKYRGYRLLFPILPPFVAAKFLARPLLRLM
ncbi:MAG: hypothetical protein EP341_09570 [Sphingomonadales bacterium]|nr:MAG: hypothetical protein EP341_09570 [Sphingomonadales bacterium]